MQASELPEVFPFLCISAIWGQYLVVFHILSSLVLTIGSGCSLMAAGSQASLSFLGALVLVVAQLLSHV